MNINKKSLVVLALVAVASGASGAGLVLTTQNLSLLKLNHIDAYGQTWEDSDQNLKTNVQNITPSDALSRTLQLQGKTFTWSGTSVNSMGFLAQDVEAIYPDVVRTGALGYKTVNYAALTAAYAEAIQRLDERLKVLEVSQNPG